MASYRALAKRYFYTRQVIASRSSPPVPLATFVSHIPVASRRRLKPDGLICIPKYLTQNAVLPGLTIEDSSQEEPKEWFRYRVGHVNYELLYTLLSKRPTTLERGVYEPGLLFELLKDAQSWSALCQDKTLAAFDEDSMKSLLKVMKKRTMFTKTHVHANGNPDTLTWLKGVNSRQFLEVLHILNIYPPILAALSEEQRASVLFCRVHGIGPAKAKKFAKNGATTLKDLQDAEGDTLGEKLPRAIKVSSKHFEDLEELVPRCEIDTFSGVIDAELKKTGSDFKFEVVGSYRRGEALSSDIDVVFWHPSYVSRNTSSSEEEKQVKLVTKGLLEQVKQLLFDSGYLAEENVMSEGPTKIFGVLRAPVTQENPHPISRQLDVRICPTESLPYMLVGSTGNKAFMKIIRETARKKGFVLNEYEMGPRLQMMRVTGTRAFRRSC